MFFDIDREINNLWCMRSSLRCTHAESIGLWSSIIFYATSIITSVIHIVLQERNGTAGDWRSHKEPPRSFRAKCSLVIYLVILAVGILLWNHGGIRYAHPYQLWPIQLVGSAILWICTFLFIKFHMDLGEDWSPFPEAKEGHHLVTEGVFRWARHPMYATSLWASIGTLLATLNWVITWCVCGGMIMLLSRIEIEERIMLSLFGERYLDYQRLVSALGPPWSCLGFDKEMKTYQSENAKTK